MNQETEDFFVFLYTKYYRTLKKKAAFYMGSISNIEDLVQDTFIRLIPHAEKLSIMSENARKAYILTTLYSVTMDYFRKSKNEALLSDTALYEDHVPQAYDGYTFQISQALHQLSDMDQKILYYKYFMGYSGRQIAKLLNIGYPGIYTYLTRARKRFKTFYDKKGMDMI